MPAARDLVTHVALGSTELLRDEGDENHVPVGEMDAAWAPAFKSGDRQLEVGYWTFSGEMETTPFDGREMLMIVIDGAGAVSVEDAELAFGAGDVVIHDSPVGVKRMASDGLTAVYVTRFRTPEALAAARPSE